MNIKNRKDLFTVFAAVVVLLIMFPRALPPIKDKIMYAGEKWHSGSGVWMMPDIRGSSVFGAAGGLIQDLGIYDGASGKGSDPVPETEVPDDLSAPVPDVTETAAAEPVTETTAVTETAAVPPAESTAVQDTQHTGNDTEITPYTEYTEQPDAGPAFVHSDSSYFDNALFIGDSRTVDLGEFGGLDNADYYARVGMSVFNLDKKEVNVPGKGRMTLDGLLSSRGYGKVYIMLGYNEIGYNFNSIIKKYKELIERIKTAEPTAIIYLEANLLVSKEYSDMDNDADNKSLIELNRRISELADNETVFYIDVNPVFCENGALRAELSGDGTHPYAKHYKTWAQWLCDNTVDPGSVRRQETAG